MAKVTNISKPLPQYQSHKVVSAALITAWNVEKNDVLVTLPDGDTSFVDVEPDFFTRNELEKGGYLVVYEDNYVSFSPASAFEGGYTLIQKAE